MKSSVLFLGSVLLASSMFAVSDADLLKEAKNSGLIALPSDQKQVDAMLKEIGVKPNVYTEAKAELGKNFILSHVFQKAVSSAVILATT